MISWWWLIPFAAASFAAGCAFGEMRIEREWWRTEEDRDRKLS